MEDKVHHLQEAAQIFDVCDLPPFADLRVIRRDMRYLKTLWDYVFLFRNQLEGWKTSRWQEIDFNSTEDIIREITTDLRSTDKEVKKWPVFLALEASLKETTTALAAVKDLQVRFRWSETVLCHNPRSITAGFRYRKFRGVL